MELKPGDLLTALRAAGITVHHATFMPGARCVAVFLEASLGQGVEAAELVQALPGVRGVRFSGHTRSIMYVDLA